MDFAEICKSKDSLNLKIILFCVWIMKIIKNLKHDKQCCKKFWKNFLLFILATNLSILSNYFDNLNKIILIFVSKFLNSISAKFSFPYRYALKRKIKMFVKDRFCKCFHATALYSNPSSCFCSRKRETSIEDVVRAIFTISELRCRACLARGIVD